MDTETAMKAVEAMKAMLPQLQEALREKVTQTAVDGGAAVAVRPWSFRHPLKGETDPWFGLHYHEWLGLRKEGFAGVYTTGDAASGRAKLMIIFDRAAEYLAARSAQQAAMGIDRSEATAPMRRAKEGAA
jgi:hypothetical protein